MDAHNLSDLESFVGADSEQIINKTEQTQAYLDQIENDKNRFMKATKEEEEPTPSTDDRNTYFLPFSRQTVYATMMPLSFNISLMNSESMISKIVDHKITLEKVKGTGPRLKDSME